MKELTLEFLLFYLETNAIFFGTIVVLGLVMAWIRTTLFRYTRNSMARGLLKASNYIGVPIHELSHALFALFFGHKITELKLYKPDPATNTLGYVRHSHNPKSRFQNAGNFFIGIAPIINGALVIILLMRLLIPGVFHSFQGLLRRLPSMVSGRIDKDTFLRALNLFKALILKVFTKENLLDYRWWIFMVLTFSIAMHMELSGLDIKNSFSGLGYVATFISILDVAAFLFFRRSLSTIVSYLVMIPLILVAFMSATLVITMIPALIVYIRNH